MQRLYLLTWIKSMYLAFLLGAVIALLSIPAIVGAQDLSSSAAGAIDQMELASGGPAETTASSVTGLVTFVSTRPGFEIPLAVDAADSPESRALQFVQTFGEAFGLDSTDRVIVTTVSAVDVAGMEHVRLQQVIGGIPVTGGELTVHLRGATVVAVNAKTLPGLEDSVTIPAIPDGQAEDAVREALLKYRGLVKADLTRPRLELFNRGLLEGIRYPTRLAWFVEATAPGVHDFFWIDAEEGFVLLSFSQLAHALQREIYDAEDGAALPGTHIRSEGEAATGDADADLAYDYAGDTYDYFLTQHGRDSFDGAGATLTSTVHFCPGPTDCPHSNAFWNGSQVVYGDGYPPADDVVAHEWTHAVTDYSASLFYYMQSGALNESYSDIFGETVDQGNSSGNDSSVVRWLIGEDIQLGGTLRDMMNPNIYGDPGKMSDPVFVCEDPGDDGGGLHSNSGVPNHAFALMVDGGSYNELSITGIGSAKAAKIQYRALTHYLLSASDFLDNANALRQSCTDLVGTAGISAADCGEVERSLNAVEMSRPWPCSPPQAEVPLLCPSGGSVTDLFFDDLETIDSGQWITGYGSGGNHWIGALGDDGLYWPVFATSGSYSFRGFNAAVAGDSWVGMSFDLAIPTGAVRMQFAHSYGFDNEGLNYYDGGVLEYSTDGGSSWIDAGGLMVAGATYGGTILNGFGNPLGGRSAFSGDSFGYTATQLDLSSLGGQNVRFRFHIGTDISVDDIGWFIDDIRVYTCATLYDQTDSLGIHLANSQQYETSSTADDSMAADDFEVPPGEAPWMIDGLFANGLYTPNAGPAPFINVEFLSDTAGLPGSAVCTYTGLAAGVNFDEANADGDFSVRLPSTCSLPAGTYWVMVQPDMDFVPLGRWFWKGRTVQSGSAFAWQNPGDGFGTGCTSWTTAGSCLTDPDPDLLFALWSDDVTPPVCFALSLSHTGSGSDPKPLPIKSPGCAAGEFVASASVTLIAAPAPGWEVVAWTGTDNNSSTSTANTVTMSASAHAASVTYAVSPCYTLTLGHIGAGADPTVDLPNSPECGVGTYHADEVMTLLAQPAPGLAIGAWSGTDNDASLTLSNTATMPAANHDVMVSYVEIPAGCYLLHSGHSGQGSDPVPTPWNSPACPGGTYAAGQTVLLEASADDGWTVGGWTGTDDDGSFLWVNSLDMPAGDHSVTARYMTPTLAKDVHPGIFGAFNRADWSVVSYTAPVAIESTLFFAANDGVHGMELWKSDGTPGGTVLVKDIWPGAESAFPWSTSNDWFSQTFANVNGTLFFVADDGIHDYELWKSDGTADGTVMVKDIFTTGAGIPDELTNVAGTLFFAHTDGVNGIELWKSDGTADGTVMVKDIVSGAGGSSPDKFAAFGDLLIFRAGEEPWISDGTEGGTVKLKDISVSGGEYSNYIQVNDEVFFSANDGIHDHELWKSDGTTEGTMLVKDISPGDVGGGRPNRLTAVGGTLFFQASDTTTFQPNHGKELWKSDGTEAGTMLVKDIAPGSSSGFPSELTEVAGKLIFKARGSTNDWEPWISDGTEAGTEMITEIVPGPDGRSLRNFMEIGDTVFFATSNVFTGEELWQSDGTEPGTQMVLDIWVGRASSYPDWMTDAEGVLFFRADDGIHGSEIWVLRDDSRCHSLTLNHTGQGADPVPDPVNSQDCDTGYYEEGEVVTLTASQDPDWTIGSWSGSDNDGSTSTINTVTMPAVNHAVTVHYSAPDIIFADGFEQGDN
jgi:bacillolysin